MKGKAGRGILRPQDSERTSNNNNYTNTFGSITVYYSDCLTTTCIGLESLKWVSSLWSSTWRVTDSSNLSYKPKPSLVY